MYVHVHVVYMYMQIHVSRVWSERGWNRCRSSAVGSPLYRKLLPGFLSIRSLAQIARQSLRLSCSLCSLIMYTYM